jgi:hypothetical protein
MMWRTSLKGAALIGLIIVAMLLHASPAAAQTATPPPFDTRGGRVEIISPRPGDIIQGSIRIVGTALSPEEFDHYELAWAPDPAIGVDAWQDIQPPVAQQVLNNVLGLWESTIVPDGRYLLRLRMVRGDGTFLETQVRIEVANATITPTFTASPTFTNTPPAGPATAGPSPTPLIQQPATRTPRPTQTPGGPTATPIAVMGVDSPFRPANLRAAACQGAVFTMIFFVGIGLYGLGRTAARGQLRVTWWRFKTEFVQPLMDRFRRKE